MTDREIIECAVAIRMICSNPSVTGGDTPAVMVGFSASEAEESAFEPDELVTKLAESVKRQGIPATVSVKDAGTFTLRPARQGGGLARMEGVVVLVTGAAQGFGKGIAAELAHEGAVIAVADVNEKSGAAFAAELNKLHGEGSALFCRADVTDSASLDACVAEIVRAFGGIDMLVSNAGVLKAGGLEDLEETDFDLVTQVNYKGFFLCARAVSAVMRAQHRHNPGHAMDIVEINSKSGLTGSNRNFAYAGSKFGGIGLTQSFALELLPFNIKVNAVCPGNYFDGPLWSDPENGLFVQYLRAGKVEGAKTVEDVKKAYVSRVPMNRGCTPRDVARAIFYLREQEYETGQAIPVTGGQVMLK